MMKSRFATVVRGRGIRQSYKGEG
ncbi:hypothetical protein PHAMO_280032 [Magnetospirillum molischianum DSM 120]|uniref:Uncharacterized protein n=1 Tax=Magnetospirillum molischianum DSM 120 TaxID=1150626 RepID=H8FT10_MAGML|nr:hypothetical protein PHAMO_280032 [Magnetospirillum molischianum DSM 120]